MSNIRKAKLILEKLYHMGVRDFVVCPGGRNAPFVELLGKCRQEDVKIHWGFEERSASFFALGLTLKELSPTAVLTTSGTAFVETSSALLEAHYSGLPLIVISSDRPEKQWGTGAPQTLMQKDFLLSHLGPSENEDFSVDNVSFPLHINCSFEEPLLDEDIQNFELVSTMPGKDVVTTSRKNLNPYKYKFSSYSKSVLNSFLNNIDTSRSARKLKPLFIFTGLSQNFKDSLDLSIQNGSSMSLKNFDCDMYFESTGEIESHDSQLNSRHLDGVSLIDDYDFIVRVGGIPTHRIWRDIEINSYQKLLQFSALPLPGLSYGDVFSLESLNHFLNDLKEWCLRSKVELSKNVVLGVQSSDHNDEKKIYTVLKEIGFDDDVVFFVGNSLPIRYWDLDKTFKFNRVYASRGLNGIDGQLSTAIGLSLTYPDRKVIAVLGDLTTMYDLTAAWYWLKNKSNSNLTLLIVNNSGGQIFSKMFKSDFFVNQHSIKFQEWSKMWSLSYQQILSSEELKTKLVPSRQWPDVIELNLSNQKQLS